MYIFNQKMIKVIFFTFILTFSSLMAKEAIDPLFLKQMRILSESRGNIWKAYKAYDLIGMNNNFKNPKSVLENSIKSFELELSSTKKYAKDHKLNKVLSILKEINTQWSELKKLLLAPAKADQVNTIDKESMKITRTIIKALKAMGEYDKSGNWKYLEQTQKAQNIAERLATLYLSNSWGAIDNKRYNKMMDKVIINYGKVVKLIKSSKFYTPEIKKLLKDAQKDFSYFTMMRNNKKFSIPTLIYQKSSELADKMAKCTDLIVDQLK